MLDPGPASAGNVQSHDGRLWKLNEKEKGAPCYIIDTNLVTVNSKDTTQRLSNGDAGTTFVD